MNKLKEVKRLNWEVGRLKHLNKIYITINVILALGLLLVILN